MKISNLPIKGLQLITLNPIEDNRGQFTRLFCKDTLWQEVLVNREIKQINRSVTKQVGSIRGMHFQYPPADEMKFVQCLRGAVWDVAIDLRPNSATYLESYGLKLSCQAYQIYVIPEGFAHGFQVLEEDSELLYFHTSNYQKEYEGGLRYDDPKLQIMWPLPITEVSVKDRTYPLITNNFSGVEV
jgi:dTDP-4-dehydrorhamnose 3,5-epimerase